MNSSSYWACLVQVRLIAAAIEKYELVKLSKYQRFSSLKALLNISPSLDKLSAIVMSRLVIIVAGQIYSSQRTGIENVAGKVVPSADN